MVRRDQPDVSSPPPPPAGARETRRSDRLLQFSQRKQMGWNNSGVFANESGTSRVFSPGYSCCSLHAVEPAASNVCLRPLMTATFPSDSCLPGSIPFKHDRPPLACRMEARVQRRVPVEARRHSPDDEPATARIVGGTSRLLAAWRRTPSPTGQVQGGIAVDRKIYMHHPWRASLIGEENYPLAAQEKTRESERTHCSVWPAAASCSHHGLHPSVSAVQLVRSTAHRHHAQDNHDCETYIG